MGRGPHPMRVVYAGNLLPDKNVDAVLTALSSWKDKRPFEFTIIGDGVCLQPCIRLAEKLGIADSCRFTGRLTREQTLEAFRKAEVFVMISSPETLGLVYLEAMSQGASPSARGMRASTASLWTGKTAIW